MQSYKHILRGILQIKQDGSYDVTCGGAVWNWEVGDVVNSPYLTGGTATIINKVGAVFTLSTTANTSITDWLLGCILVPYTSYKSLTGTSSPIASITPMYIGQEFLDTAALKWYKATGLTKSDWVILN